MTPAGTSNELDVLNEWEENTLVVLLLVRYLEVHVTHVYNDQMDSVFSNSEIRQFGKKKWNVQNGSKTKENTEFGLVQFVLLKKNCLLAYTPRDHSDPRPPVL